MRIIIIEKFSSTLYRSTYYQLGILFDIPGYNYMIYTINDISKVLEGIK